MIAFVTLIGAAAAFVRRARAVGASRWISLSVVIPELALGAMIAFPLFPSSYGEGTEAAAGEALVWVLAMLFAVIPFWFSGVAALFGLLRNKKPKK